ncbi:hypothetical protein [Caballeronia sp. 15715]|uniref:hypothetical protein n=1 Tax=unclassified Caballeronia TaxID=2646786 RepID=UPI0039E6A2C3
MKVRIVKLPALIGESATPDLSAAIWILVLSVLCFVSINHEALLPERFLLDQRYILERMMADVRFEPFGDSFDNLAWCFRALGIGSLGISLFGYFVSTLGLLLAVWRSGVASLSFIELIVIFFWLFDQTVYIGLPSKEIVISSAILLILLCRDWRFVILVFIVCTAVVAIFFRSYWAITLVPTLLLYFGAPVLRKPPLLLLLAVVMFVCVAIDFRIQYGEALDFARQSVNEWRDPSEVASLIVQIIPGGNIVSDVSNTMLILGTFLLPLPLILSGVATQTLGGICTFFSLVYMFGRYQKRTVLGEPGRFDRLCFCFTVSFLATQAIFEPDYGSFLRHLSPISPLLLYLLLSSKTVKQSDASKLMEAGRGRLHFSPRERRWIKSSDG